jgi:hypothetical protein
MMVLQLVQSMHPLQPPPSPPPRKPSGDNPFYKGERKLCAKTSERILAGLHVQNKNVAVLHC